MHVLVVCVYVGVVVFVVGACVVGVGIMRCCVLECAFLVYCDAVTQAGVYVNGLGGGWREWRQDGGVCTVGRLLRGGGRAH